MKISHQKVIFSGDILEVYQYEKPLLYSFERPTSEFGSTTEMTEEEKKEVLKRSLWQTRSKLIRNINANARQWMDAKGRPHEPKFVTFTFKENVTDVTEANHEYTNFLKKFNYFLTKSRSNHLKYAGVPEFQKRGAVHYHVIFFNLPWFNQKKLAEIWDKGHADIRAVSHVPNIGMYMTKYMTKDGLDERLRGRKRFFTSKNLNRPLFQRDPLRVEKIKHLVTEVPITFFKKKETEYQGKTNLRIYNLAKFPTIKDAVLESLR